jgi:hypothetical protein
MKYKYKYNLILIYDVTIITREVLLQRLSGGELFPYLASRFAYNL